MSPRCLIIALLAVSPAPAIAGQNAGAEASLSWSPTSLVSDAPSAATMNLYVRFTNMHSFQGAEIDVVWEPADAVGCFEKIGQNYKTSTTCTYLNRGSTVPVYTFDDPGHLHVAWANNTCNTSCTEGAALQILFAMDACPATAGCFSLTYAGLLDCVSLVDVATITGAHCTVNGGSNSCRPTAARPRAWGTLKSFYRQ